MKIVLLFVFALPASFVSAQSTTSGSNMSGYAAVYAEQPNMTLALLEDAEATATVSNAPATTITEESAAPKSMSEELSAWVENKQAVLSSVKKSKRLK